MMAQDAHAVVCTRAARFDVGNSEVECQADLVRRSGSWLHGCRDAGIIAVVDGDLTLLQEDETAGPDFGMKTSRTAFGNRQNDLLLQPGRDASNATPSRAPCGTNPLQDTGSAT
jgi:hypothetical protein